jgi:hypothetical protein
MSTRDDVPRNQIRGPLATGEAIANEPAPFPKTTTEAPFESVYADWRERLTANLSRRSDGRWEPLTWIHDNDRAAGENVNNAGSLRAADKNTKD